MDLASAGNARDDKDRLHLYAIGGRNDENVYDDGGTHRPARDAGTARWTRCAPAAQRHLRRAAAAFGGRAYISDGMNTHGGRCSANVLSYNPIADVRRATSCRCSPPRCSRWMLNVAGAAVFDVEFVFLVDRASTRPP